MKKILYISLFTLFTVSCFQPKYRQSNISLEAYSKNKVDLNRYLGLWYEIYRLPNGFEEKNCKDVTAVYSLNYDGTIKVLNSCILSNGKIDTAEGVAKVDDNQTNSKLKVSFFRPFYGDYWILDLADDYSWSIVGEPSGKYLWVLSRIPVMNAELEEEIVRKIERLGYNKEDLIKTPHTLS